ncbi:MAG TPA: hypothetical protein PLW93_00740 [Candidatus Absconditabacterales bacterium]|nr:hypothetical protein [Candidatus Absconditabacterales bacterium]HMY80572.1 hypothetical protein [Candidatus Absconditabacterales bacterium]HNG96777.1 hypothetical protein [Candidatus Absconditabacterales bacterium]
MSLKNKLLIGAIALGTLGAGNLKAQDKVVNNSKKDTIENFQGNKTDNYGAYDDKEGMGGYLQDVNGLYENGLQPPTGVKLQAQQDMAEIVKQLKTPNIDERIVSGIIAERMRHYSIEDYDKNTQKAYLIALNEYLYEYLIQSLDNFIYDKNTPNQNYNDFMNYGIEGDKEIHSALETFSNNPTNMELLKYQLKDIRTQLSNIHEGKYNSEQQKLDEYVKYLKNTQETLEKQYGKMLGNDANKNNGNLAIGLLLGLLTSMTILFGIANRQVAKMKKESNKNQ